MPIALHKRKSPPIPELPEKILLVRSDNIGDVICTTPCFEALKQRFPKAIIAVLVCRLGEEVVQGNPFLDEIYVYDKAKHGRYRHPLIAWYNQARILWQIRKRRFDVAVGVRSTFSASLGWLVYASGAPLRIGVPRSRKTKRAGIYYNFYVTDIDQDAHEVERSLSLLKPLNVFPDEKRLYMPLTFASKQFVEQFLAQCHIDAGSPLVVINYNSRLEENRWWAEEKYAELLYRLQSDKIANVVLSHGPGDEEVVRRILHRLSFSVPVFFSSHLTDFAALIKRGKVFVSLDGGPVHVGAAVGTPTIAIHGKTNTPVWRPWGKQHRVLKRGDHPDMVTVEDVYEAVTELLKYRNAI